MQRYIEVTEEDIRALLDTRSLTEAMDVLCQESSFCEIESVYQAKKIVEDHDLWDKISLVTLLEMSSFY
jgi:hypothetical protein